MPASRPLGLIAIVLIIDISLAAAGGVLLSKGLASRDGNKSDTTSEPKSDTKSEPKSDTKSEPAPAEQKSEAPAPPNGDQVAAASAPVPSSPPPIVSTPAAPPSKQVAVVTAARSDATQQRDKTSAAQTKTSAVQTKTSAAQTKTSAAQTKTSADQTKTSAAQTKTSATPTQPTKAADDPIEKYRRADDEPQDPYPVPNTEQEIDKAAAKSKATFDRCASSNAAHGSVKIAFQVRGDGRVINAAAVENTTDNAELARCLVGEISTWSVSAHNGAAINLVRPFTYP